MSNACELQAERIAISKSKGIRIDWKDGHHSEYTLRYLRDHCPCATCAGTHGTAAAAANPFQMYQPTLKIDEVEPVGNYAIRLNWSDGHRSGIYSYELLPAHLPLRGVRGYRGAGEHRTASVSERTPSQQPEGDVDPGDDGYGLAVLHAGAEAPLLDRLDGLLVQAQAERVQDLEVGRVAALVDDDLEHHGALELGLARFFGVFGLHLVERDRRRYAKARDHDLGAAGAGADAGTAVLGADSMVASRAYASATARTRRRRPGQGRRIAPYRRIHRRQVHVGRSHQGRLHQKLVLGCGQGAGRDELVAGEGRCLAVVCGERRPAATTSSAVARFQRTGTAPPGE